MEYRFKSKLKKERIIEKLRMNTFYSELIIRPQLFFGNKIFYGQVTEERIRIGKNRFGRGNYPVFEIIVHQNEDYSDVVIRSDSEEQIKSGRTLIISMTLVFITVIFIIGTVLSFKKSLPFMWTLIFCFIIGVLGIFFIIINTNSNQFYNKNDLNSIKDMFNLKEADN